MFTFLYNKNFALYNLPHLYVENMSCKNLKQLSKKLWIFKVLKFIPHLKNCVCFSNVAYKFLSKKIIINFFCYASHFQSFPQNYFLLTQQLFTFKCIN
jgi:hypothetical protein